MTRIVAGFCLLGGLLFSTSLAAAPRVGDADLDGDQDIFDARAVLRVILGIDPPGAISPLAMAGNDNVLGMDDAQSLGQIAAGLRTDVTPSMTLLSIAPPPPASLPSEAPNLPLTFTATSAQAGATLLDGWDGIAFSILEGAGVASTLTAAQSALNIDSASVDLVPLNQTVSPQTVTVEIALPIENSSGTPLAPYTATVVITVDPPVCGDGVTNGTDECDEGGDTPLCDSDCTFSVCGDGYENAAAGEDCDEGDIEPGDGCAADCTWENPLCGNAVLDRLSPMSAAEQVLPTGADPAAIAIDDFDDNGTLDIAVINRGEDTLLVMRGNGDGTFTSGVATVTRPDPTDLHAADLNGDAYPDLVITHAGIGEVTGMLGNGDGSFATPAIATFDIESPQLGAPGDFDETGGDDFAFVDAASGRLHAMRNLDCCGGLLAVNIDYAAGVTPVFVTAFDYDGGTGDDLIVVNRDDHTLSVFRNLGGFNNFDTPLPLALDSAVSRMPLMVDLAEVEGPADNDRYLDIVTADGDAAPYSGFTRFSLRRKLAWDGPHPIASEPEPLWLKLTDFNDDLSPDILAVHAGTTNAVACYPNDGSANFGAAQWIPGGNAPVRIDAADFDGDGREDLVLLNAGADTLSVIRHLRLGEVCDDGNRVGGDGCDRYCRLEAPDALCGNGVVDTFIEQCDDGENGDDSDDCLAGCIKSFCGDNQIQTSGSLYDECDDGLLNDNQTPNACRENCILPPCGDGVTDDLYGEECDDGAANEDGVPNACRTDCTLPVCGDGVLDFGEVCDDGNTDESDQCDNDCELILDPGVPDTGHTACWDITDALAGCPADGNSLSRQDGALLRNAPNLAPIHTASVVDYNTGLVWEQSPANNNSYQRWLANSNCATLVQDGFDDWRLPTIYELMTIADFGRTGAPYWLPIFGGANDRYWSSTRGAADISGTGWVLDFTDLDSYSVSTNSYHRVRCVRGPSPALRQTTVNGPVVVDWAQELVWQPDTSPTDLDWYQAVDYCLNLELGGYDDWWLPTTKEWESIIVHDGQNPAIEATTFSDSLYDFWSATTVRWNGAYAFSFDIAGQGGMQRAVKNSLAGYRARCVRALGPAQPNNGVLDLGEECDDGKHCDDGTPCIDKNDCVAMGTFNCLPRAGDGCELDGTCTGGDCSVLCGDGALNTVEEVCDDGNTDSFDGCSDTCQLEAFLLTPGLADTGQERCYSSTASVPCLGADRPDGGQDGWYDRTPMSFTSLGDVVVDDNTGLMWEQTPAYTGVYQHGDARSKCAQLVKGGFDDWRLPSAKEFLSIVYYGTPFTPHVDTGIFSSIQSDAYWSDTPEPSDAKSSYSVLRFDHGWQQFQSTTSYNRMLCVRGAPLDYRVLGGAGSTVTDGATGLMWSTVPAVDPDWSAALAHCNGLVVDSHDDWRLPDVRELSSIVDPLAQNPAIDATWFSDADADIWSSTTREASNGSQAYILRADGRITYIDKPTATATRAFCVRGNYLPEPGNGIVDAGEECDDGNSVPGDGCENDGTCTGGDCAALCGNGVLDAAAEECDDNNLDPYDGCSPVCLDEPFIPTVLADTAQVACWDDSGGYPCVDTSRPWGGQDGYFRHTPAAFSLDGETITDLNTGLMWEASRTFTGVSQHWTSRNNCLGLSKAGYDDWRLPTVQEMMSIATFGYTYGGSAHLLDGMDANIGASEFWTGDHAPQDTQDYAWAFRFQHADSVALSRNSYEDLICVRGPEVQYGDLREFGPVTVDVSTGLMWQRDVTADLSWESALAACNALVLAGHEDWRVPDIRELASILNPQTQDPAFNLEFLSGPAVPYWSSTTRIDSSDGSQAYQVRFDNGRISWGDKPITVGNAVRCVRGYFLPHVGNAVLDNGEACDDGMHCDDGSSCAQETDCTAAGSANCMPRDGDGCENNGTCTGGDCTALCGDGWVNSVDEECDDGNNLPGDGCTVDCLFETIPSLVADTGQDYCAVDGSAAPCLGPDRDWGGQDGYYRRTPQSFTELGEVVLDNFTGLMWEQTPAFGGVYQYWDARNNRCATLSKGGFDDWRLPTVTEFYALLDFGYHYAYGNSLPPGLLSSIDAAFYWTDSRRGDDLGGTRYRVHLDNATTGWTSTNSYERMLCVRGPMLTYGAWRVMRNVAVDDASGLMWTRDGEPDLDWHGALNHCNDLVLAGHTDWRLPDVRELSTIFDSDMQELDRDVFTTPVYNYWSSTSYDEVNQPTEAHVLETADSRILSRPKSNQAGYGALCVRSDFYPRPDNGVIDAGEECDDGKVCSGGTADGDDCTVSDRACLNGGGACIPNDGPDCTPGGTCIGDCLAAFCGNGLVDSSLEACDDANTWDYDGCSADCQWQTLASSVADTGQYLCFDDDGAAPCRGADLPYGAQDGAVARTPLTMSVSGNTVIDANTGLIWQRGETGSSQYSPARNYCRDLVLDGFTNWRLPTIRELLTIAHYGKPNAPAIADGFVSTQYDWYWSQSRPAAALLGNRWALDFTRGTTSWLGVNTYIRVRCVQGDIWAPRDLRRYGGVVVDKALGHTWQQNPDPVPKTWSEALDYCNGLLLQGYDDWRLPDIRELALLTDQAAYSPALSDYLFDGPLDANMWSATSVERTYTGSWAYAVSGVNGRVIELSKAPVEEHLARCIRSDLEGRPGNGVPEPTESCDDGNLLGSDDCDPDGTCPGGDCLALCGNGTLDVEAEECDDGNTFPDDGCDATCRRAIIPTPLYDTGQDRCYDETTPIECEPPAAPSGGQDAWYVQTPLSYSSAGAVTIDNNTGLMWQASPGNSNQQWAQAYGGSGCQGVTTAGFGDWRLPTHWELMGLLDYAGDASPTIDTGFFSGIINDWYWTSSAPADFSGSHYAVHLGDGDSAVTPDSNYHRRICVRGGTQNSAPAFKRLAEVAVDTDRGLMWQRTEEAVDKSWTQALDYCNALTLAGYDDWRLPSVREALSATDWRYAQPAVDATVFAANAPVGYWTGTTAVNSNGDSAYGLSYADNGYAPLWPKTELHRARCVRSDLFSLCGNGLVEGVEECDDGDTDPLDGCDGDCLCETAGCPDLCGNGTTDAAGEECDDGNSLNLDGCNDACLLESPVSLPADTGQQSCWDENKLVACPPAGQPYSGQDAQTARQTPVYSDSGNGTLIDGVQGLEWELAPDPTDRDHAGADAWCNGLNLAGQSDWRLPTMDELVGIVDVVRTSCPYAPAAFSGLDCARYWVAEIDIADPTRAWVVDLGGATSTTRDETELNRTICVRGPQLVYAVAWSDTGNGTAINATGGLMAEIAETTAQTWSQALAYCDGLVLDTFDDWRLPDLRELQSITALALTAPAIDPLFSSSGGGYWTSTTREDTVTNAYSVDFTAGSIAHQGKSTALNVRCVRGGITYQ